MIQPAPVEFSGV